VSQRELPAIEEIERLRSEGAAYNSAGMFVESEARLSKALLLLRARAVPERELLVDVLRGLASSYRGQRQTTRARETASEALRLLEPGTAEDDGRIWRLEREIGESYALEGKSTLAIASHRQALEAAARHPELLRESVVRSQMDLSVVLMRAGDGAAATHSAEDAWQVARQRQTLDPVAHDAILNLAATYVNVGRVAEAERLVEAERGVLRIWRPRYSKPEVAPLDEGVLRPRARGRVVGSGEVSVRLSDAWAYCAYKFRAPPGGAAVGTARLTTLVGPDGGVSEASVTSFGLSEPAADCMVLEAAAASFPPPAGDGAVIVFATETFP
jgi:hypothetical protein